MQKITSRQNPKIRLARALQKRKSRDAEGLFLLEGIFHIGEAAAAGAPFEFLLVAPDLLSGDFASKLLAELESLGIPVFHVDAETLASLSSRENPRGLLAVIHQQWTALKDLHPANFARSLAVVSPQDPGNLGTLLRTIDAAGADGLLLLEGGVDPFHPSALRAAMGAHFWKVISQTSFKDFTAWAKEHGYKVYGSSARGGADYRQVDFDQPFVLLLGSEREGLSIAQQNICTQMLSVPMRGRVTSLNLSVAAGVLLYTGMDAARE